MGFMADLIIAIIIISGMSVGMLGFLDEMSTKYSDTVTEPLSATDREILQNMNYTGRITSEVTDPLKERLKEASEKRILENIAGFFVGSVVSAGLLLLNIPLIITSFVSTILAPFASFLPTWVNSMINAIIVFMFVVIIIRMIMKWKL